MNASSHFSLFVHASVLLVLSLVCSAFPAQAAAPPTLQCPSATGREATLVLNVGDAAKLPAEGGWVVVSTASAACVGQALWHPELRTITVHGDDPLTTTVDGALPGEALTLQLYDDAGLPIASTLSLNLDDTACTSCESELTYKHDALYVIDQLAVTTSEIGDGVTPVASVRAPYPNPTRDTATVEVSLPVAEHVRITLYDVLGRSVRNLHDATLPAGTTHTPVQVADLASGAYLVRVESASIVQTHSFAIVR